MLNLMTEWQNVLAVVKDILRKLKN